jgi:hypothetical protein
MYRFYRYRLVDVVRHLDTMFQAEHKVIFLSFPMMSDGGDLNEW